jgi:hypothetical protein
MNTATLASTPAQRGFASLEAVHRSIAVPAAGAGWAALWTAAACVIALNLWMLARLAGDF